jgi:hypothetical protein
MVCARNSMHHRHMPLLVAAELPQPPVDGVLLTYMSKRMTTSSSSTAGRGSTKSRVKVLSYGPSWAHYLGGYQDRLLGGPLGLPGLRYTAPEGMEHKDYGGEVLG